MTIMKFGRRAPVHNLRTMRSALALARALSPLGTPPAASDDYVVATEKALAALPASLSGGRWGVFLNDRLGDCVCADSCHQVMLHTANAGKMIIPTEQDCLSLYEAVGGYVPGDASTDQGCSEVAMCHYLETTGLAGQKSAGSGALDPASLDSIRWSVQLFGAARLGIMVTQSMMDDFSAARPWTALSGSVLGGHDVPVVRYDSDGVDVVTWGTLQRVSWSLMADSNFLDEAHAEVWPDFLSAAGTAPNGFDLPALLKDLQAVASS